MKIMCIGDAHCDPKHPNDRFTWLGHLAIDEKPDVIVDMGDFENMGSLSSYDVGKKSFEGRTYVADIECAHEARDLFAEPLHKFNAARKRSKERQYRPSLYALGGNHFEGRVRRAIEIDRKLEGLISVEDNGCKERGWDYVPFLEPLLLGGLTFQHYFTSGVMGRPIGGENPADTLIKKTLTSSIQGHSHLLDIKIRTNSHGKKVYGIHSGCYFEHEEEYAGHANKLWSRGILILDGVKDGEIENFKWIDIKTIKEKYSAS